MVGNCAISFFFESSVKYFSASFCVCITSPLCFVTVQTNWTKPSVLMEEVKANKCSCLHIQESHSPPVQELIMEKIFFFFLCPVTRLLSISFSWVRFFFSLCVVGKKVQVLSGHKDWISCCSVSSDCSMIASVGRFDRVSYIIVKVCFIFKAKPGIATQKQKHLHYWRTYIFVLFMCCFYVFIDFLSMCI